MWCVKADSITHVLYLVDYSGHQEAAAKADDLEGVWRVCTVVDDGRWQAHPVSQCCHACVRIGRTHVKYMCVKCLDYSGIALLLPIRCCVI